MTAEFDQQAIAAVAAASAAWEKVCDLTEGMRVDSGPTNRQINTAIGAALTGMDRHELVAFASLIAVNLLALTGVIIIDAAYLRSLLKQVTGNTNADL